MKIEIDHKDTLLVTLRDSDGEFRISYGGVVEDHLTVHSELPDQQGREGIIYDEPFGHTPEECLSDAEVIAAAKRLPGYFLTPAEVQSNFGRVHWAEKLILQLPEDHDGRNTWLLNFGRGEEAAMKRHRRGIKWVDETKAAETISMPVGTK